MCVCLLWGLCSIFCCFFFAYCFLFLFVCVHFFFFFFGFLAFFFSSRRRHTRCALVTGVQTCALPISVYHGPDGLVRIARRTHRLAAILAAALRKRGVEVGGDFFDTLHVTGVDAAAIHARAAEAGINLRRIDEIGRASWRERVCTYV